VLQRVNPIFPPEIHEDIDAVTRHLALKGLTTPRLVATVQDEAFVEADGAIWRLLTRIPGVTQEALTTEAEAREAGRVLGEFHRALADFAQPLKNQRPPVHELPRHLATLEHTLAVQSQHPAHREISAIADRILGMAGKLTAIESLPPRLVHGDPKISNIVFRDAGTAGSRSSSDGQPLAVCLIDLDTLTRMPVALEIGDALRSWCNTAAEDSPAAGFSLERYSAAIAGYRQGAGELLTRAEWRAVPTATLTIAIELAARFAADALNESYFSWDRQRYASASAHNQARAEAQLKLATSITAALPLMQQHVMTEA
jgi:Ser/Thr protein kinase RdoA (MazF antagonist)